MRPAMTIRISTTSPEATRMTIVGRLTESAIGELEEACARVSGPLIVDVSDLRSADQAGEGCLRRLALEGACLEGMSPYMELWLR